jgi:hypothetical protein
LQLLSARARLARAEAFLCRPVKRPLRPPPAALWSSLLVLALVLVAMCPSTVVWELRRRAVL